MEGLIAFSVSSTGRGSPTRNTDDQCLWVRLQVDPVRFEIFTVYLERAL